MNCNSSKEINWNHPLFTCVISQRLSYICFSFLLFWQKFAESYIWKKREYLKCIASWNKSFPSQVPDNMMHSLHCIPVCRYKLCAGWPGKPFMLHLAFHIELYRPYTVKAIVIFSLEMNVPWLKSKQETDIKCFLYTCSVIQNNKVYNFYFDKLKRYLQN